MEDYYKHLDGFLHSHKNPHFYNQEPYTYINELDENNLPPDNVIYDHNNKEEYYPPNNDNYDYPDDRSHNYHMLSNINELNKNEYPHNRHYYPDETYNHSYPTPDNNEPQFPSINSEQYWTPDKSLETTYHTANDEPYEDLEDYCCAYCARQHPDNWCSTPHYSCLNTCLIPKDHPHYIDDIPINITCPVEGQHCPYSYWA